MKDQF